MLLLVCQVQVTHSSLPDAVPQAGCAQGGGTWGALNPIMQSDVGAYSALQVQRKQWLVIPNNAHLQA